MQSSDSGITTRLSTNIIRQSTPAGALTNLTGVWPPHMRSRARWKAKSALGEARHINPGFTLNWLQTHSVNIPPLAEGLRKAGLPEE